MADLHCKDLKSNKEWLPIKIINININKTINGKKLILDIAEMDHFNNIHQKAIARKQHYCNGCKQVIENKNAYSCHCCSRGKDWHRECMIDG